MCFFPFLASKGSQEPGPTDARFVPNVLANLGISSKAVRSDLRKGLVVTRGVEDVTVVPKGGERLHN